MKFLTFTIVALCVSLLGHAFMDFAFDVKVPLFGVVWWVITIVSGVMGWFASEEIG